MIKFLRRLIKAGKLIRVPLYRKALHTGIGAAIDHEGALKTLDCSFVVDVGANKGQFALVAHHCFPAARIISFEPLASPAAVFRRIFSGNGKVELHELAIGPQSEEHLIHISAQEDSSSLLPITELQTANFPGTAEKGVQVIRVEPLTKFLSAKDIHGPALLKIDVQGYELSVLKGAEALLASFDFIYAECSFVELYESQALADDIISYLQKKRFALAGVYNLSLSKKGAAIQADFLFHRRP